VAAALNNMAALYKANAKYDDAEPLYKRALAIWEKTLGKDSHTVGNLLMNLAEVYRAERKPAEAAECETRANAILNRH
jgi:tetratricopeptide (TPR) repeat protein